MTVIFGQAIPVASSEPASTDDAVAVRIVPGGNSAASQGGTPWNYAASTGGMVNNTPVTIKAAAPAGIRNYITSIDVINTHATVATEFSIRDGSGGTVLWRQLLPAVGVGGARQIVFATPLRSTAATLLEVICGTTGAAVFFNAQGFMAP